MRSMFDNPRAFDPMYEDRVTVANPGGVRVDCRACVFDLGIDDPFADGDAESTRRRFAVHIPLKGCGAWPQGTQAPKVGWQVTFADGALAHVTSVSAHLHDALVLEAREA